MKYVVKSFEKKIETLCLYQIFIVLCTHEIDNDKNNC